MIDYGLGVYLDTIERASMARDWRNDPEIRQWCREYRLITPQMQQTWANKVQTDDHNYMFSICVRPSMSDPTDGCVGVTGLTGINWVHRSAEFSIYIAPEYQHRGYATAALKTLIRHGFDDMGLNRIWGETFTGNPGSRLYKRLGFLHEGHMREAYYKEGHYIDAHIYSMLRSEFSPLFEKAPTHDCLIYPDPDQ